MDKKLYLSAPQLKAEISRCLGCKTKPCMTACPVSCCPQEFIAHALKGEYDLAIDSICRNNPMGQTCGLICPETFCMKSCLRGNLDSPLRIPHIQAALLEKYRTPENCRRPEYPPYNNRRIAVIGAGPAGIAATWSLIKQGCKIVIFECSDKIGGALNLIPESRLPREIIAKDWNFLAEGNDRIELRLNTPVQDPSSLLSQGFDGVIVATGESNFINLGIEGEEHALTYTDYLRHHKKYAVDGNVAIIGGGSVATDCAVTAKQDGAENVEMFVRRRISDMRVTNADRKELLTNNIDITTMTRVVKISPQENGLLTVHTVKTRFKDGRLEDIPNTQIPRPDFARIVKALGSTVTPKIDSENIIYAGDCKHGGSTIVEALASGLDAAKLLTAHFAAAFPPA